LITLIPRWVLIALTLFGDFRRDNTGRQFYCHPKGNYRQSMCIQSCDHAITDYWSHERSYVGLFAIYQCDDCCFLKKVTL